MALEIKEYIGSKPKEIKVNKTAKTSNNTQKKFKDELNKQNKNKNK